MTDITCESLFGTDEGAQAVYGFMHFKGINATLYRALPKEDSS
jgi:hypothetical protein